MTNLKSKIAPALPFVRSCWHSAISFVKGMKIPLSLAFLHFFVTTVFQLDKAFFEYDSSFMYYGKVRTYSIFWYYCAVKFLYLAFLAVLYCTVAYVRRLLKSGNESVRRGCYIFSLYAFLMLCLLLVLWPGTWAWDDIGVVVGLHHYGGSWWQHFITSIVQIVFLQLIPCPGGIVIIQNVIISACVAYFVTAFESCFPRVKITKSRFFDTLIKLIPFLLPGVLTYQFSGYRLGLYVYLELSFIVMLISSRLKNENWSFGKVILFAILSVLVAEWRTEGMFFFPLSCVLLLIQKKCIAWHKVFGIVLIVLGFCTTDFVQKKLLKNSNYELISTMTPAVELIRHADSRDEAELSAISRILNLQAVYDYPDKSGTALYWLEEAHAVNPDYTKSDYKAYLRAFFTLSLRHPLVVTRERFLMFWNTSAFAGKTNVTNLNTLNNAHTAVDFDKSDHEMVREFAAYPHNQPIFPRIRTALLKLWANGATYRLMWNPVIPLLFLAAAWIYFLAKRKWYFFLILTGEAVRVVLSFLTAPSAWFMYYLPEYLLGWTLAVYAVLVGWSKRRGKGTEAGAKEPE